MRRFLVAAGLALVVTPVSPTAAHAGGGCHDENITDVRTRVVSVAEACFTPVVARIAPGQVVEFRNTSGLEHNIGGAGPVGFNDFQPKAGVVITFAKPGIYPFACTFHPGMVGAIVVERGAKPSPSTQLTAAQALAAAQAPEPVATEATRTVALTDESDNSGVGTAVGVGVGTGIVGLAGGIWLTRRRRLG